MVDYDTAFKDYNVVMTQAFWTAKNDWSYYTQSGDYSFDAAKTQFTDWSHVTVYRNGLLVWGIEP